MLMRKSVCGVAAAVLCMAASPAAAKDVFCWANNRPDNGGLEVIYSGFFQVPYDEYMVGVENRWRDHLDTNGWFYNGGSGCQTGMDADDIRYLHADDERSRRANGWEIFYADFYG